MPGGIELRGQAAVLDALVASSLRSRRGKNLVLESWNNFTASARSRDGRLLARFTVGKSVTYPFSNVQCFFSPNVRGSIEMRIDSVLFFFFFLRLKNNERTIISELETNSRYNDIRFSRSFFRCVLCDRQLLELSDRI